MNTLDANFQNYSTSELYNTDLHITEIISCKYGNKIGAFKRGNARI